jgi:hypothetical protein
MGIRIRKFVVGSHFLKMSYACFHPTGLLHPSHSCCLRASSDLASHLPSSPLPLSSYLPTALCVSGTREYASVDGPRRRACRVTEVRVAVGNARGRWLGTSAMEEEETSNFISDRWCCNVVEGSWLRLRVVWQELRVGWPPLKKCTDP